jgi:hypothetical protein
MLTVISAACAADNKTEIPLKVKKVEGKIALNENIKIQFDGLKNWIDDPNNDYSKFVLYIDGNAINGLRPSLIENDTKLRYDLKRTTEARDSWIAILSRKPRSNTRIVHVTVRQQDVKVEGSAEAELTAIHPVKFWLFVIIFAGAIILFWRLASKSDIIRNPGPQPNEYDQDGNQKRKPYSLARTQMAAWFFIVVISYVFIWMMTRDLSNLTPSVLALIGISAVTGLSSAAVDLNQLSDKKTKIQSLENKKKEVYVFSKNETNIPLN